MANHLAMGNDPCDGCLMKGEWFVLFRLQEIVCKAITSFHDMRFQQIIGIIVSYQCYICLDYKCVLYILNLATRDKVGMDMICLEYLASPSAAHLPRGSL